MIVHYAGFPGNYYQPPEPAELTAWCPKLGRDADMWTMDDPTWPENEFMAQCECGHEHELST